MRKLTFLIIIILSTICTKSVMGQASESDANRKAVPGKDKVWKPSGSPEQKAAKRDKKRRKAIDPNKQLTKKELGKKLKQDEIDKKKNYTQFHDKLQSKKVRKRMKENSKKSTTLNTGERPSFWRRVGIWFRHKKK